MKGVSEMALSKKERQALENCFLFSNLSPVQVEEISRMDGCACREFARGSVIYGGESFERCLGLFVSGSATVSKPAENGKELAISRLSEGMIFGAAAIFNDVQAFTNVITAQENCRVLMMEEAWLHRVMQMHFSVAEAYIRYLSDRILFLNGRIASLAAGTTDQIVTHFLLQNGPQITISMTELASRLNIGRASLYRVMDRMEEEGIIERSGKTIVVKHPERLHMT